MLCEHEPLNCRSGFWATWSSTQAWFGQGLGMVWARMGHKTKIPGAWLGHGWGTVGAGLGQAR